MKTLGTVSRAGMLSGLAVDGLSLGVVSPGLDGRNNVDVVGRVEGRVRQAHEHGSISHVEAVGYPPLDFDPGTTPEFHLPMAVGVLVHEVDGSAPLQTQEPLVLVLVKVSRLPSEGGRLVNGEVLNHPPVEDRHLTDGAAAVPGSVSPEESAHISVSASLLLEVCLCGHLIVTRIIKLSI